MFLRNRRTKKKVVINSDVGETNIALSVVDRASGEVVETKIFDFRARGKEQAQLSADMWMLSKFEMK